MSEPPSEGGQGTNRLVLGFDGGCITCSNLATRIKEQVGDQLEIRSLREPQVEHWRKQSLGEGAPWAPTLVEVKDGKVRAWTGWKMGLNLSRRLGAGATWRVMQALGEFDAAPRADGSLASGSLAGLTRGQFLKGIGGMMVAMSIVSSTDVLSRSVSAAGWVHPLERVGFGSKVKLQGEAKREALRAALGSQDVRNIWYDRVSFPPEIFAVRHTFEDGNTLTAVSWQVADDKVIAYYAVARPIGHYHSQAMLLSFVPEREVVKTAESVNGEQRTFAARGCGCCRWRWDCVAAVASGCVGCASTCATCVATPAKWACGACLSCALVGCPLGIRRCCRRPCG